MTQTIDLTNNDLFQQATDLEQELDRRLSLVGNPTSYSPMTVLGKNLSPLLEQLNDDQKAEVIRILQRVTAEGVSCQIRLYLEGHSKLSSQVVP